MAFASRGEYDRGLNTFSPEGRLYQVEYALEAVKLGSTSVGIRFPGGVVLASEKRFPSPLIEPSGFEKIMSIGKRIGCSAAGLQSDARTLVEKSRKEATGHWFSYNEDVPVESVVHFMATEMIQFADKDSDDEREGDDEDGEGNGGQKKKKDKMSRPYGTAVMVAGFDKHKQTQLFVVDPSGSYTKYKAAAIGSAEEAATTLLNELMEKKGADGQLECENMTLASTIEAALVVLRTIMQDKMTNLNVELGYVLATDGGVFTTVGVDDLKTLIEKLPAPTLPTLH